jgi:sialate O-acetylesterase
MAFTCDYGRKDNTHPLDNQPVGERLARLALHNAYGQKNVVCYGPIYRAHKVEGNKVRVTFEHADGGLKSCNGKPLTFFEVAGADNVYHRAKAEIAGADSVLVWGEEVAEPKQIRFAWHDVAGANLVNGGGLPALCFRTDKKCPPPLKYEWPGEVQLVLTPVNGKAVISGAVLEPLNK